MSWNNKVIWSEGMFLRPQHFQQQNRYIENYVESRCVALRNNSWGIRELKLDHQLLSLGKFGIASASGVFPDGTPFNIPDDYPPPAPIDVPEDIKNEIIYLALPARRMGTVDTDMNRDSDSLARFVTSEYEARDNNAGAEIRAPLQVGELRMRLLPARKSSDGYVRIGLATVKEVREDKNVVLDDLFIPPAMDSNQTVSLGSFLKELQGLLHTRGEALAARVSQSGRGGAAEIADFLMLQLINRYEPLVAHLVTLRHLHPESLFRFAIELAGEIATFTNSTKRPVTFPKYCHDDLQASFTPVFAELRQALSMVIDPRAVAIPLQERKFGIRVAPLADRSLLTSADFVLAVSAALPFEELLRRFPAHVKIGSPEQIRDLVNNQLPGIGVRSLAVAPRQIPYHSGFAYFELDRGSEFWKPLLKSGGFAIHLGGEFPGLEMEFWAIRE